MRSLAGIMGCAASVRIKDAQGKALRDDFHLLPHSAHREEGAETESFGAVARHLSRSEPCMGKTNRCQRVVHITSEEGSAVASSLLESGQGLTSTGQTQLRRQQSAHTVGASEYTRRLAAGRLKSQTQQLGAYSRKGQQNPNGD